MSRRNDRYRRQGPRPRDLHRTNQHAGRRRIRAALRQYRYLRMPQLSMPDVAVGAGLGFGVLAAGMLVVGWLG